MNFWRVVLLLIWAEIASAQFEEPLVGDTLRADSLSNWADSTLVFADSTAPAHASLTHGWLYPLGVMAVTCMGFLMLFTTRSR